MMLTFLLAGFQQQVLAGQYLAADPLRNHLRVNVLQHYHPKQIQIDSLEDDTPPLTITATSTSSSRFNFEHGFQLTLPDHNIIRSYAGHLEVHSKNGVLELINLVRMEDYVASVVLSEMGWQKTEAMRAQAVLARTWAARHRRPKQRLDFGDRTNGQVYKGLFSQTKRTKKILRITSGQQLRYHGQLANVYYHAKCGERIYSAYEIWGGEKTPYLSSHALPPPLYASMAESWQCALPLKAVNELFTADVVLPNDYILQRRDGISGVLVRGLNSDQQWFAIDQFRIRINRKLGWNKLKSNSFSIFSDKNTLYFQGKGFGHLVGLCQQGAVMMARSGQSYREILQHFYPGTIIYREKQKISELR